MYLDDREGENGQDLDDVSISIYARILKNNHIMMYN